MTTLHKLNVASYVIATPVCRQAGSTACSSHFVLSKVKAEFRGFDTNVYAFVHLAEIIIDVFCLTDASASQHAGEIFIRLSFFCQDCFDSVEGLLAPCYMKRAKKKITRKRVDGPDFTVTPRLQEAFVRFLEYHPAKRLSVNLRSWLLEFLMYDGSPEAEYLKDLVVDLDGLFGLLEVVQEEWKGNRLG